MTDAPETPAGMRRVSKDEFYAFMGPQDVHPSTLNPQFTVWELRNREVIGRSYPGWKNPGEPKAYFIRS